jgi:hypothetical protein
MPKNMKPYYTMGNVLTKNSDPNVTAINDVDTLLCARKSTCIERLYEKLVISGYINPDNDRLTTGIIPFNRFARYGSGAIKNCGILQHGVHGKFMVCGNDDDETSMAGPDENGPGHVFMTTTDLHWQYFNILTLTDKVFLKQMRHAATNYALSRKWTNFEFIFNCYPLNDYQSMYLHIVNLDCVGPNFDKERYRNLTMDDAIRSLK